MDLKERDGPMENGQTLVSRGTVLGTRHTGTEKNVRSRSGSVVGH